MANNTSRGGAGANNTNYGGMSSTQFLNSALPLNQLGSGDVQEDPPYGTSPDQNIGWSFYNARKQPVFTFYTYLLAIFTSNALFNKIITLPAQDVLKEVIFFAKDDLDEQDKIDVEYFIKKRGAYSILKQAIIASKVFGGGAVIFLNEDIKKNLLPLSAKEKGVRIIASDCWYLNREEPSGFPSSDSTLGLLNQWGDITRYQNIPIHPSRAIAITNTRPFNYFISITRGWGVSEYDTVGQALNLYDRLMNVLFTLVKELNYDVISVTDLSTLMNHPEGTAILNKMVRDFNYAKSVNKTILKDKDDSFDRKQVDISGAITMIDKATDQLCASAGLPKRYLFGEDPKGLNNGGDASLEIYNSKIESMRSDLTSSIIAFYEKCCLLQLGYVPKNLDISFGSIRSPSYDEKQSTKQSQYDVLYELFKNKIVDKEIFTKGVNQIDFLPIELDSNDINEYALAEDSENIDQDTREKGEKKEKEKKKQKD
jgi:phage-related protein (TIGR01555 family)